MTKPSIYDFIPTIESQAGDRYVFGAEARFSDPNPGAFDCSELIEWGLARLGVPFVDGAQNQFRFCRDHHTAIPVAQAVVTWGALLFRITPPHNHVAVSLGNGQTFEARGKDYGVNTFESLGRLWTAGGLIPGLDYSQKNPPVRNPPQEDDVTPEDIKKAVVAALYEPIDDLKNDKGPRSIIQTLDDMDQRDGRQGRDLGAIKTKLGL